MPDKDPSAVIRTRKRLFSLFNIRTSNTREEKQSMLTKIKEPGSFSDTEINLLKKMNRRSNGNHQTNTMDAVKQDLFGVSANVSTHSKENKEFQVMVPEINKARSILIPSILSPSDMYGELLQLGLNCPQLDTTIVDSITTLLSSVFNEKLHLGSKLGDWLGVALFDEGATPVLVVPRSIVTVLAGTDKGEMIPSTEAIGLPLDNVKVGIESITDCVVEDTLFKTLEITTEDIKPLFADLEKPSISTEKVKKLSDSIADSLNNSVTVSLDYRKVKSLDEKIKEANKVATDKTASLVSKIGDTRVLNLGDIGLPSDNDEPLLQALPSESVIPVHVPGSPESHIGYFILLDGSGNPVSRPTEPISDDQGSCGPMISNVNSLMGKNSMSSQGKLDTLSTIFELSLRKTLNQTITGLGIDSGTLPDNSNIYSCIFHRAMNKEKVDMVYVPTSLMSYYAFDYRDDGTGKALLEDASFLIRMRTSFLVAKVIASLDNATDKHTISFSMEGQKGSNLEQIMGMIKDAYVSKNMFSMDHNPMTVMKDIVSRSIRVVPTDMEGVHDLQLNHEVSQGQKSVPDEDVPEMLTDLIVTSTGVPAAALNALGEDEYSRSVATTNILYSNTIRTYQNTTCDITETIVKAYSKNSHSIISGITDILTNSELKISSEHVNEYLAYIINNITVNLPKPNIAPDKSRYEELDNVVSALESTMEKLIPDDIIVSEQDGSKDMVAAIRADLLRKQVRVAMENLGATGLMDVNALTDIDFRSILGINRECDNYSTAIKTMNSVTNPEAEGDSGGSSW